MFILLCESDQRAFLDELNKRTQDFIGAIFPSIIHSNKVLSSGALVAQLEDDCETTIIKDIANSDTSELKALATKPTLFCFVDAFSEHLETFLSDIYMHSAEGVRIIGGGAGKMTLKQEPVIFNNQGLYTNAAVIVGIEEPIGLGVAHGWKKLEGPFLVTGANGRTLHSLDYEAAKDFYSDLVKQQTGTDPSKADFFQIAKSYPLGVVTEDEELVVRDPIAISGTHLSLVGDVHEYALVHLLNGDTDSLLDAAATVSSMALKELGEKKPERVFICDCISRSIFLDSDFQKELDAVTQVIEPGIPTAGALTLGEIASKDDRMIRFHNKTCVVAIR